MINIIVYLFISLLILLAVKNILIYFKNRKNIDVGNRTIIGKEEIQEDYSQIICKDYGSLAVIGDGFGKNGIGKISSIIGVKTIINEFEKEPIGRNVPYFFKSSYIKGNKEVLKRIESENGGTSLLSAIIVDNLLYYSLVGEAMICVFRKGELIKLSNGHTMGEVAKAKYSDGKIMREKALAVINKEKILYYMGQESFKNIEIIDNPIKLEKNDVVVLMSKGIYKNIYWVELEELLSRNIKPYMMCEEIIDRVKCNTDNCNGSIILIKYLRNKAKEKNKN